MRLEKPIEQVEASHPLSRGVSSRALVSPPRALALSDEFTADNRRALWLPKLGVLAVADLHIGYAWTHRSRGQLLPVSPHEDTVDRLLALQKDYQPQRVVLVGDIVHGGVTRPEVRADLERLVHGLSTRSAVTLILGNHDQLLERVLPGRSEQVTLCRAFRLEETLFIHGDSPAALVGHEGARTIVMGHEHPTVSLGDGVASAARCPCFLIGRRYVVLPAFSPWASGCTVGRQPFLSPLLHEADFHEACAIMGQRMLRIPLK